MLPENVDPSEVRIELGGEDLPWGEAGVRAIVTPTCGHAAGDGDIAVLVLDRRLVGMETRAARIDSPPVLKEEIEPIGFGRCALSTDALHRRKRPVASIDTVSDRDFALEFLSMASIAATHLSRLAEEIVIWSTPQFGFIRLSDAFSTGSSIMPQKKNPDAAELVRAKTGRINGSLIALLTVMKGLPLAYSKDMQEDKEQVFDAAENLELAIAAMTGMVSDMAVNEAKMKAAAGAGYSTATDLADWLVRELGVPFREAHHVTGRVVALAESKACDLWDLPLDALQAIHAGITDKVFEVVTVEASVASRKSYGGTAPDRVREQIAWWRARN